MQDKNQDKLTELNSEQKIYVPGEPHDKSRRHFALASSAVLLTVASRPVLANTTICKTPSGFLSANLSHHGKTDYSNGCSPGYWKSRTDWPSPYTCGTLKNSPYCNSWDSWKDGESTTTKCKDTYSCTGKLSNYAYYKKDGKTYAYSLMQVLWMDGSQDPYQFGAHMCAALLNARKGWTPCLPEQKIKDMWYACDHNGYYEPTAGVKWYPADCVNYLKSTMS